jgi:hypothetical protein
MADRGRTPREFQVGELVLLKLQPYAQKTVVNKPYPKLSFKFFGPFNIVTRIGAVAYKLDLPEHACSNTSYFHVSQLKAFHPKHTLVFAKLPRVVDLSGPGIWPEEIVEDGWSRRGIMKCLKCWSNGRVCLFHQQHGKISMWSRTCFLMPSPWDKQVLLEGEMSWPSQRSLLCSNRAEIYEKLLEVLGLIRA